MRSKKDLFKEPCLYLVADRDILAGRDPYPIVRSAIKGGVSIVQVRDKMSCPVECIKFAKRVKEAADPFNVPVIMNDRLETAIAIGAHGIHVGQGDLSLAFLRALLGDQAIIGVSCAAWKGANEAWAAGADYIGVGPVFYSPVKEGKEAAGTSLLKRLNRAYITAIAIGGIDRVSVKTLRDQGIRRVAVIRSICNARSPETAARALKESLGS